MHFGIFVWMIFLTLTDDQRKWANDWDITYSIISSFIACIGYSLLTRNWHDDSCILLNIVALSRWPISESYVTKPCRVYFAITNKILRWQISKVDTANLCLIGVYDNVENHLGLLAFLKYRLSLHSQSYSSSSSQQASVTSLTQTPLLIFQSPPQYTFPSVFIC